MSGAGAPDLAIEAAGLNVVIVAASWHDEVMTGLVDGALRACGTAGVEVSVVRVAGSFELPLVCLDVARDPAVDAVVALGVVIRGGTPHFDYVCNAATDGLNRVALDTGKPIGFGLLTCDSDQQAIDRAGLPGSHEDKGAEATWAAITTAVTLRDLREQRGQ